MTDIAHRLAQIKAKLPKGVLLVAVSKTRPVSAIQEAYNSGQRIFGENKALELRDKQAVLPKDIAWHMIGQLQTNKVKYIAPFVALIHSVDRIRLLDQINTQAEKNDRIIDVLIQVYIAREESKTGFSFSEAFDFIQNKEYEAYPHINVRGFMGMATHTPIDAVIEEEFGKLSNLFKRCHTLKSDFNILSMGMSDDYPLAISQGATMIRVGSSIFES